MNQYCAYTLDEVNFLLALKLIRKYNLNYELHACRVRFWVSRTHWVHVYCALKFKCIDHETDHMLGI
jgi:hypothetical protein